MTVPSTFLDACRGKPVDHIPVWYMRQAGRYQPEYRKIRERYSLVEICQHPDLCAEVTMLPVQQLGVDAAILFSDIMIPLGAMGVDFEIREHVGPVLDAPITRAADIDHLRPFTSDALPHVFETVRILRRELTVPLIGFAGAPFTLASYLIEGKPSRSYIRTKQMMWGEPEMWRALMDKLADMVVTYAEAQVEAGAAAIQLFDSWVGSLSVRDFRTYVLPTVQSIFRRLQTTGVPLIYFGVNTGELLSAFAETGATVIGVDWRVPLAAARERVGSGIALQGNLDPVLLFAPWPVLQRETAAVLDAGMTHPGFIFNLGHGVAHHQPPVEVGTLRRLTEFVHEYTRRAGNPRARIEEAYPHG
ncbi:MAG: uroporphyrinogen decarboxylase [Alicyclobacillus sp.]|nr:uroporphyrinogen decarboxylase [Alicyclobacillus sp.]